MNTIQNLVSNKLTWLSEILFKRSPVGDIEDQLKQSQESLEFALESGRMFTWDIHLKDNSLSCSRGMLDLWGVDIKDFKGQREILQSKVHPDDVEMMNNAINDAIAADGIYELEYRILPSPGVERWVLSRGRCTFEAGSRRPVRFSGVVFDITEKKKATQALHNFFTIAGHELKTPLTLMQLNLHVNEWNISNKYPEYFTQENLQFNLKKQFQHLKRITRIIDNILDESRINEGRMTYKFESFDLHDMAVSILEEFKVIAEANNVEIQFHSGNNIIGSWDRFRLEQVLLNLLMNAIRYGNNKPIWIEVKKQDEKAVILVRDQGIGIKEEDHCRIFERFERAVPEDQSRGMGLGLYLSKSIVEAHMGEILLASQLNEGSEFTVVLPL